VKEKVISDDILIELGEVSESTMGGCGTSTEGVNVNKFP
jgi:hypothetical protein